MRHPGIRSATLIGIGLVLGLTVSVLNPTSALAEDDPAVGSGAISGRVYDDTGSPAEATVVLDPISRGGERQYFAADSDGGFAFDEIAPGSYRVMARKAMSLKPPIAFEFNADFADYPDVVIEEGTVLTDVPLSVTRGGSIGITVDTASEGGVNQELSPQDAYLLKETSRGWEFEKRFSQFTSLGDGRYSYSVADVPPGRFAVRVYYNARIHDSPTGEFESVNLSSPPFSLEKGQHIDAPLWTLRQPGALSGRVSAADPDIEVDSGVRALVRIGDSYDVAATTSVEEDGSYRFLSLAPGSYRIQFTPAATGALARQFWPAGDGAGDGLDVEVVRGVTTPGIDSVLREGGVIEGTLTSSDDFGAYLRLFELSDDNEWVVNEDHNQRLLPGPFQIRGLLPGSYRLELRGNNFATNNNEYFDDVGLLEQSETIEIASREDVVRGVDVTLEESACLIGALEGRNGEKVGSGSVVTAYRLENGSWQPYSRTGGRSRYELSGLPPGTYRIGVSDDPDFSAYRDTFYGDARTVEEATDVVLEAGVNRVDLDIALDLQMRALTDSVIVGEPRVGSRLTARAPVWSPYDARSSYQWLADGAPIAGADQQSFIPTEAERGSALSVRVDGERAGYVGASARSDSSAPVASPSPEEPEQTRVSVERKPIMTGALRVGRTIRMSRGRWAPRVTLKYRWFASGKRIRGESGRKLELRSSHRRHRIVVKVTARSPGLKSTTVRVRSRSRVR